MGNSEIIGEHTSHTKSKGNSNSNLEVKNKKHISNTTRHKGKTIIIITQIQNTNDILNIKIPLNNETSWWEQTFPNNTSINNILSSFSTKHPTSLPLNNELILKCNNNLISLTNTIQSLLPKGKPSITLNITYEIQGLPYFKPKPSLLPLLVGKPIQNPFEIFVFNRQDKMFKILTFDKETIVNYDLDYYSRFSACCNVNNTLYISGGENRKGNILNHFWSINLHNKEITKQKNSISYKKMHSMIYIPDNYIFVTGGNDKCSFYYDIELQTFEKWANMNIVIPEPALAFINGRYIYAFNNIKNNENKITFERTDLGKKAKWEVIFPQTSKKVQGSFRQKFFAVAPIEKDNTKNIIFLGGSLDKVGLLKENINNNNNNNNNKNNNKDDIMCFQYNIDNNLIIPSETGFIESDFLEKTFMPLTKNNDFIIPSFNRNNPQIVLFNRLKNVMNVLHFGSNANNSNTTNSKSNVPNNNGLTYSHLPQMSSHKYNFNMPKQKDLNEQKRTKSKMICPLPLGQRNNNGKEIAFKLGETYMNKSVSIPPHQRHMKEIGDKNFDMKNSGSLGYSSIIKNGNGSSFLKRSMLPSVNKPTLRNTSLIKINTKFSREDIFDLKDSLSIGIGGRKVNSRLMTQE